MAPTSASRPGGRTTLKDELSDLLNTTSAPRDFDPEALDDRDGDDDDDRSEVGSGEEEDEDEVQRGRGHYVDVGKSKLRAKIDEERGIGILGEKYQGMKVGRGKVFGDEDEDGSENEDGEDNDGEDEQQDGSEDEEEGGVPFDLVGGVEDGEDEEIDSDEAFGEGEEEGKWKGWKFRGSRTTDGGMVPKKGKVTGSESGSASEGGGEEDDTGEFAGFEDEDDESDSEGDDANANDDEDEDDSGSVSDADSDASDNELRKIMARDNAAVNGSYTSPKSPERDELRKLTSTGIVTAPLTSIPAGAQTDVEKGIAVRKQQATFDGFLGGRIKLQKALVAVNSLALVEKDGEDDTANGDAEDMWKEAEEAAVKLWNKIAEIRMDIVPNPKKRKHPEISTDTPISTISSHITSLSSSTRPWRASVLTKWTEQALASSTSATTAMLLPHDKRLNNTPAIAPATGSGLPLHLHNYIHPLGNPSAVSPHLIARAHIPRACAPVHTARNIPSASDIYDDTDFYQLLLRTLVDQRLSSTATASVAATTAAVAAALKSTKGGAKKVRRNKDGEMVPVDTKASKGRRLRYTVHEKLQDFMAPVSERHLGWWEDRQANEFFGSLLGRRTEVVVDEEEDGEDGEGMDVDVGDDGLRVFG